MRTPTLASALLAALLAAPAAIAAGPADSGQPLAAPSPAAGLLYNAVRSENPPGSLSAPRAAHLDQVVRHLREGDHEQGLAAWERFARDYFNAETLRQAPSVINHVVYRVALESDPELRSLVAESRFRSAQAVALRRYQDRLENLGRQAGPGGTVSVPTMSFPATLPADSHAPSLPGPTVTMTSAQVTGELRGLRPRQEAADAAATGANGALLERLAPKAAFFDGLLADVRSMAALAAAGRD